MNAEVLPQFKAVPTLTQKPEPVRFLDLSEKM